MKTIIMSDCHIGSKESNHRLVNNFLKNIKCDRLILLGDFWDLWDLSYKEIKKKYWRTTKLLKEIVDNGTKVTLLLGNHDEDYLLNPIMPLNEINVKRTIDLLLPNGCKVALIHGHEFDPLLKKHYTISKMLAWMNRVVRKIFGKSAKDTYKNKKIKTCTDLEGKKYSKMVDKIHYSAKSAYSDMEYDALIMGHTHSPVFCTVRGPSINFYNAGDWKWSNTYIEINDNIIELKHYKKNIS